MFLLGDAFYTIGQSEEGQVMLTAMEGLAKKVHTETSFSDAVKVCFRLAKKITKRQKRKIPFISMIEIMFRATRANVRSALSELAHQEAKVSS